MGTREGLFLWEHRRALLCGNTGGPFFLDLWEHVRASALEGHFLWEQVRVTFPGHMGTREGHFLWEHGTAPFYVGTCDPLSEHAHWSVRWTPTFPGPVGTREGQWVGPPLMTSYSNGDVTWLLGNEDYYVTCLLGNDDVIMTSHAS